MQLFNKTLGQNGSCTGEMNVTFPKDISLIGAMEMREFSYISPKSTKKKNIVYDLLQVKIEFHSVLS